MTLPFPYPHLCLKPTIRAFVGYWRAPYQRNGEWVIWDRNCVKAAPVPFLLEHDEARVIGEARLSPGLAGMGMECVLPHNELGAQVLTDVFHLRRRGISPRLHIKTSRTIDYAGVRCRLIENAEISEISLCEFPLSRQRVCVLEDGARTTLEGQLASGRLARATRLAYFEYRHTSQLRSFADFGQAN